MSHNGYEPQLPPYHGVVLAHMYDNTGTQTYLSVEDMASATGIYRMAGWTSVEGMACKAGIATGEDKFAPRGSEDEQN